MTTSSWRPAAGSLLALCVLLAAAPAAAQGRGNAFGHGKKGGGGVSAGPSAPAAPVVLPDGSESIPVSFFGSWLDDATTMVPGTGFMSFGIGYWRMPGYTEVDVPAFDVSVGIAKRVQVGASVPVYHASEPGGPVSRGVGDLSLSSKIQLRDPGADAGRGIGFAVLPLLGVSSTAPGPGESRMSWALPASVELRRERWRTYASTGYFSRGSVFASAALELSVAPRVWVTGTISGSRATRVSDAAAELGIVRVRTDVSGSSTFALSDSLAVYGAVGRTISRRDPTSTNLFVTGGLAIGFAAWQP